MLNVLTVFGTRPEAIKMCPLVLEIEKSDELNSIVCVTGQHRSMLDQVLEIFHVKPDYDLQIMKPRQTITSITTDVLTAIEPVLEEAKPDVVLVHGDTTTSMAAAMAAFYKQIPVGHVEAGLRTHNIYSPFPEEMNRKIISAIATYHFAPTENNKAALVAEGINEGIAVTGNTVIDAFQYTTSKDYIFKNEDLQNHDFSEPTVILTAHRRENLGEPLKNICQAVNELTEKFPELKFVYPVHLNPAVREVVFEELGDNKNVTLTDPVDVQDLHNAMNRCKLVMTDSGGLQEEAPHLGKPVIVLRTETERPEAVAAGTAVVAGVNKDNIVKIVSELLEDEDKYLQMSKAVNPYGDGTASKQIVEYLKKLDK